MNSVTAIYFISKLENENGVDEFGCQVFLPLELVFKWNENEGLELLPPVRYLGSANKLRFHQEIANKEN